jgi:hypothetical protein
VFKPDSIAGTAAVPLKGTSIAQVVSGDQRDAGGVRIGTLRGVGSLPPVLPGRCRPGG